ncbi:MAG: radical SAM protein, partial [Mobilitalea sp.]
VAKGLEYTSNELLEEIVKYKSYMEFSGGGVTFTGGEPLLQAEFILELSKMLKQEGITIAVDTSGYIWNDTVKELLEYVDLVMLDIKNFDPDVYNTVTGVSLAPTLELLDYLKDHKINTWIRYVLVPNLTDNVEAIEQLSLYLDHFPNVSKIELLGFHKMGEYKWEELGLEYKLSDTKEPSKQSLQKVKEIFEKNGKKVAMNG